MKIKILLILFFNISCLYGQENILTARDAIIEVQKKISTYTNIKLSFDFTIAGDNEFTNSDFEGILYVEKKKYFLQIKNFIKQINDGNLKYTINDDSKEVMVDSTDENSVNIFEPQKLLSTLIKDYKISWDITQKIFDGRNIRYINLEPKNSGFDSENYLIGIDFDYNLYKIVMIGNENLKSILRINKLEYNLKLNKNLFKFSEKDYTDYYIDSF